MPDPTSRFYSENARKFYDATINLDMEELYRPFLELIPKGCRILDAGCGSGRDSLYFIQKGYSVVAFDYSKALVKLASELINAPVLCLSFAEMDFNNEFDGVWACASLLHVSKGDMIGTMERFFKALKPSGILYASFKWGHKEELRKERLFNDYTEDTFKKLIDSLEYVKLIRLWKTEDVRPNRKGEYWLNVLLQKG
jgi:SAM-dependent methyltransferase